MRHTKYGKLRLKVLTRFMRTILFSAFFEDKKEIIVEFYYNIYNEINTPSDEAWNALMIKLKEKPRKKKS